MKSRRLHLFSCVLLCLVGWQTAAAQEATPTPTPTPSPTPETIVAVVAPTPEILRTEANTIHLGDLIDVDVIGSVEYDWRGTLNPEGFLDGIDFAENPIFALCRTEEEIAADVARAYGKILREPKVAVKILDRSNRPASVLYGAVKTPQRFQIKRAVRLNELLILAGGLTDLASGQVQIFRPKNLSCQSISVEPTGGENRERFVSASRENGSTNISIKISDLLIGKKEANPPILSGDVITVLEAESIYVIGGVMNPKQIIARSQMTLSRAVASAGGLSEKADAKSVTIYRREAGETKIIEANLEEIKSGKTEDIALRAFDIVEVAQTGREKTKFAPVLKVDDAGERKSRNLPLRIID